MGKIRKVTMDKIEEKPLVELELTEKYALCLNYLKNELDYSYDKIGSILGITRATVLRQMLGSSKVKLNHWSALDSHLSLLAKSVTYLQIMAYSDTPPKEQQ